MAGVCGARHVSGYLSHLGSIRVGAEGLPTSKQAKIHEIRIISTWNTAGANSLEIKTNRPLHEYLQNALKVKSVTDASLCSVLIQQSYN